MKKIILGLLLLSVFMVSVAAGCCGNDAANDNKNQDKNANADDTKTQEKEQKTDSDDEKETEDTETKEIEVKKVKTIKEAKAYKEELKEQIKEQIKAEKKAKKQAVLEKKKGMSEAVHMLLAMENVSGGIGKQVSAIAKDFNNAYEKQVEAENKIQSRSWIKQFLLGGDKEAAKELKDQAELVETKVTELEQLKTECSNECEKLIDEQITNLETEQTRVEEVANTEEESDGLFGWVL